MKNFFGSGKKPSSSTSSSRKPTNGANEHSSLDDRERDDTAQSHSESSSPTRSPTKSSSSRRSSRPASYAESNKSSHSSRLSRHSTDAGHRSSRRPKYEPATHPLNLPPEERKRLSALAAAMNGSSMDIDGEPVNGARATTPPNPSAQTNFSVPIPNGSTHDGAPPPPPHKSNPSSPTPTPKDDAESYKAAGNRFFKDRNYFKAIEQYSKGMILSEKRGSFDCLGPEVSLQIADIFCSCRPIPFRCHLSRQPSCCLYV
jgi:DnaJ family protein C protein 7